MKLRTTLLIAFIALLLAACSLSLAEDVTPPPGYIAPTPAPTHGPVFPAKAPNIQNGATIYVEKCAACHGDTGLGDGEQGKQLPVSVPPLGVFELASKASPADWYMTVTFGNIENFMPPFASLNDQERWDVVAYAQSLSATPEQIDQGKELFSENCADCSTDFFRSQEKMALLSTDGLISLLTDGGEGIPALGDTLSKDELTAVALYLRTLTVPASVSAPEPAPATQASEAAQTESPSVDGTPVEDSEQAEATPEAAVAVANTGSVSGKIVTGSAGDASSGLTVTLIGYEHATDGSSTPLEVVNETVTSDKTGAYLFKDIDLSEGRIFLVETTYKDIVYQSELAISEANATDVTIPDLLLYESTTDSGGLVVEQLHLSFDMTGDGTVQVFELFTISNLSDKAYTFTTDGTSLPFMPLPEGAVNVGLELSQDSAPLLPTEIGFAMPPSEEFYSIIAYFNMPYTNSLTLSQPLAMPVDSALVIVPEGIKVKADQLTDEGVQQTQQGFSVQMFSAAGLSSGTTLELELSGKVKAAATADDTDNRQTLLIGAGAFGVVLILAGLWMFLRDRNKLEDDDFEDEDEDDEEDEEAEFETAEEVMDAIIALDDLHRAQKIPDEAYQKRRAALKELLKDLA